MLFALSGAVNGYTTARLMKLFKVPQWRLTTLLSAAVLPLLVLTTVLIVDWIEYFEKANQVYPFTSVVFFTILWNLV
jgi:hypothetical protein